MKILGLEFLEKFPAIKNYFVEYHRPLINWEIVKETSSKTIENKVNNKPYVNFIIDTENEKRIKIEYTTVHDVLK